MANFQDPILDSCQFPVDWSGSSSGKYPGPGYGAFQGSIYKAPIFESPDERQQWLVLLLGLCPGLRAIYCGSMRHFVVDEIRLRAISKE